MTLAESCSVLAFRNYLQPWSNLCLFGLSKCIPFITVKIKFDIIGNSKICVSIIVHAKLTLTLEVVLLLLQTLFCNASMNLESVQDLKHAFNKVRLASFQDLRWVKISAEFIDSTSLGKEKDLIERETLYMRLNFFI